MNAPRALKLPPACNNSNLKFTTVPSSEGKSSRSNTGVRATHGVKRKVLRGDVVERGDRLAVDRMVGVLRRGG